MPALVLDNAYVRCCSREPLTNLTGTYKSASRGLQGRVSLHGGEELTAEPSAKLISACSIPEKQTPRAPTNLRPACENSARRPWCHPSAERTTNSSGSASHPGLAV